ncbi:MAG: GatB/YqeY domain-containing protein [Proteobacteria bacterium]|nr:GatB/YqeY domain-containing protein [Pseudomonadota bacterium]NOG61061.1 GatB/YqeY domain-containing protein [Pseudomonadota bacterium]
MADIKNKISDEVKTAMRSKDKERLGALRLIQAAFKQKEVDERIELNDEQSITILDKMAKQHRDSITQFKQANRDDLVEVEQFELNIIEEFLPAQLSDEEINTFIENAISKTGAASIKDMGKVMGILKSELQGRADMGKVSGLIKARLNS